jgi:hypothetical protein
MLWQETLAFASGDGAQLVSSTTATSIIPSGAKITLPAGYFNFIGKALRLTLLGRMSCLNPTPGNFTLDMRLGSVVAANGGAMALNTTAAKTNVSFKAVLEATCRAIGSSTSANLMFQWWVQSEAIALAATGVGTLFAPASTPAVGTGFDSTAAQTVDVFGTFSISNAANAITIHQYLLEGMHGS